MKKIIVITGPAGGGKDYTADYLKDKLQGNVNKVRKISYADKLKEVAKVLLGEKDFNHYSERDYKEEKMEGYNCSIRELFIFIGQNLCKDLLSEDYATNDVISRIKTEPDIDYWIIPDCRFQNEVDLVKKAFNNKVIFLKIEPSISNKYGADTTAVTEKFWVKANTDVTLTNDYTDVFKQKLDNFIKRYL